MKTYTQYVIDIDNKQIDEYESYVDSLMHQQKLIQNIEKHSNLKLDFGDFLETNNLVACEIERLRLKIKEHIAFPGEN